MPRCDGELVRCHLIPKSRLRQELRSWVSADTVDKLIWDDATWVWACGGPQGCTGHHGMFDIERTIRVPRVQIPRSTERFAVAWHLEWLLTRLYGQR
jgi:hypothetical protein